MLTGTLWTEDRRGLVMTGVAGAWVVEVRSVLVRAASTERLTPRPRGDESEVLGSELKESSCTCEEDAAAGRIEDQLGPPKTPWMVWMRWEGTVRAIVVDDEVSILLVGALK